MSITPIRFADKARKLNPASTDIIIGTDPDTGSDVHYTMQDIADAMAVLLADKLLTDDDRTAINTPPPLITAIYRYYRGATPPAVDENNANPGAGWLTAPGTGTDAVWKIAASANNGVFIPPWGPAIKISGENGIAGIDGTDGTAANLFFFQADPPSTVGRKINDVWWKTSSDPAENLKQYRWNGTAWVESFAPFLTTDAVGNVTGLIRAGETGKAFVLIADKFQVWDGVSATAPFEIISGVVYMKEAVIRQVAAAKIIGGTIVGQEIILQGIGAILRSSDFVTGVSGWKISGDGAEFPSLVVRSHQLEANAATRRFGARFPDTHSIPNETWTEVAGLYVTMEAGDTAHIFIAFGFECSGTTIGGDMHLLRDDGSVVDSQEWTARTGNTELIAYSFYDETPTSRYRLEVKGAGGTCGARGPNLMAAIFRK